MTSPKVILDGKGLLTHMYYRGSDPDCILVDGKTRVNTAGWGFINWLDEYLLPILKDTSTTDIIAVWDGGNEYRTAMFPSYKQSRKEQKDKQPPVQTKQLKMLEDAAKVFLANLGIMNVNCNGVEADDLIAALCRGFADEMKMIHTVDADLLQLADDKTVVFLKNEPITEPYKGVPLNLIRLNKALVGDSSDGYGGVYRFGPKAWDELVKAYGHDGMEEIEECLKTGDYSLMEEAAEDSKILTHVLANIKDAKKCYQLASLAPDICFQFRGNTLVWPIWYCRIPNKEKVLNVLNQMGCPDYFDKFEYLMPTEVLVTEENADKCFAHFHSLLSETPFVSFDYETVDTLKHEAFNEAMPKAGGKRQYVDVLSSEITGVSFNYGRDLQHTIYVSVNHKDTENLHKSEVKTLLEKVRDSGTPLVAHNNSFEWLVTKLNLDLEISGTYDTQIMSSYVNENEEMGLKSCSERLFRYAQVSYKDTLDAAGASDMAELTGNQVLSYGCDDSLVTGHLFKLFSTVMKLEDTWQFYDRYERTPVEVLQNAFDIGVRIDFEKVEELNGLAAYTIETGMARIRELLEENCKEPNAAAAKALDKADGDNLITLDRHRDKKGMKDDHWLAKRQERLLKWEAAGQYLPYSEEHVLPTFLGTPTQINLIIEDLLDDPEKFQELKLKSVSNKAINEFITVARQQEVDNFVKWDEFLILLAEATPLKDRESDNFQKLAEFGQPYLGKGKIVKQGDELNLNSPNQMQELLYCKLAFPVRRRGKVERGTARDDLGLQGSPSTNEEAMMMAIAEDCEGDNAWKREVLETVIQVKEEMTKISLYFRPYPLWQHPRDGMIHPQVKNCGTVTRRPAGSSPNILQVAKGPVRAMYLPRWNDHVIVATDFSGQELRITGSESADPTLIDAYTGGGHFTDDDGMVHPIIKDIHSVTAIAFAEKIFKRELGTTDFNFVYDEFREWLNCKDQKLNKAANLCRKMAKVVNFLIIYGGQASTLGMKLGIPESFAEELYRAVFLSYARLGPWQEETILFAKQHGYVRTAYGTLKHLTSDIRSKNGSVRSRQERQAVNQTVQGCAADILKVVLTTSQETNLWQETESVMIAPVYDEIVSSVPVRNLFEYIERIQDLMNVTPPGHPIPMMAEVCVGPNWFEAGGNELGDRPSERVVMECVQSFQKEIAA